MFLPDLMCLAWAAIPAPPAPSAAQSPAPAAEVPHERPPQAEADTLPQEPGVWGTVHPQLSDVLLPDALAHSDRGGRATHQLLDLAGEPERGFVGVWRDGRDGSAGLYFGRLDGVGNPLAPDRPLEAEGAGSRELEPAIALSPRGDGACVWYSAAPGAQCLKLRTFDAQGAFPNLATLIEETRDKSAPGGRPTALADAGGRDARRSAVGVRLPAITMTEQGGMVGWGDKGTLSVQRFDPSGALIGASRIVSNAERPLAGPMRLCAARDGSGARDTVACAWTTREGVEWAAIDDGEIVRHSLGAGVLVRLVPALARDRGWWALVQTRSGHRLIELLRAAGGTPSEARSVELGIPSSESCDVAARGERFLISVQRAAGGIELFTLDPRADDPRPERIAELDAAALGGALAADVRVAAAGDRALLAWTGSVGRLSDVRCCALGADGSLSDAKRWNSDESSSSQFQGRIASRGGDRAAIAWLDGNSGENQLMARWIGADGQFLGEEIAITPRIATLDSAAVVLAGEPQEPNLALASGGGFLVVWKQAEERGYRLLAQAFDGNGKAQSGLLELDAGEDAAPDFKADIDVAHFGRGYAVAFGHRDRGAFVRTIQAGGRGLGEARLVSEHPACQNLSIVELDGGSLAVAWDITVPGTGNKAVRGRVLGPQLEPRLPQFEPPLSFFGDDWDPVLAPAAGGGFALAFIGGKQHSRDIFLRFFDAKGELASPLIPISSRLMEQDWPAIARLSDGSLCVAFEDDLSAYDHCYVRRVTRAPVGGPARGPATILGPIRTLNERQAVVNESRYYPRIAALAGGGFAAVWVDSRRGKGMDIRVKILGPKFDATAR